ncbi:hypothetical protein VCRA2122O12_150030 [Vibrio crassostreae]|nr:hypothetical protein VCRA2110O1_150068 [Vibrio crassostreae]CAK1778526.1 hypothetical protein VCRA2110O4_150067 [Vibrio crassostreae]CAK1817962.1 hypothetical protein VCRA2114E5_170068 [Vibrio crassostreae]CAK1958934.1 hypothetical protein VCRA2110O182_280011 [Vibrio crassostreae]CAK2119334.1 hypothetical protein VCRA2117O328_60089 [Vibrio crassostreae]
MKIEQEVRGKILNLKVWLTTSPLLELFSSLLFTLPKQHARKSLQTLRLEAIAIT